MALETAVDNFLSGLSITDVRVYTLDEQRRGIAKPNLPAIVTLPGEGEWESETFGIASSSFSDKHLVRSRLLVALRDISHEGQAISDTFKYVDDYRTAVVTMTTPSGSINVRPVRYTTGIVDWYGKEYYGGDLFVEFWINE